VADAQENLGLGVQRVGLEQVQALAHGAFERVLDGHHAEVGLAGMDRGEDALEVRARGELAGAAEELEPGKVGEGALGSEVDDALGHLQAARGGHDLAVDGFEVAVGQGTGILGRELLDQHLLPGRLEVLAAAAGLDPAHPAADARPAVEELEDVLVDLVDLLAHGRQNTVVLDARGLFGLAHG